MKKIVMYFIGFFVILILLLIIYLFFIGNNNTEWNIPNNYYDKVTDEMSYVDGPDTTYYIYKDKIIVEAITIFPDGRPDGITYHRIVTSYDIDITPCDTCNRDAYYYKKIISGKNGKVVLEEKK